MSGINFQPVYIPMHSVTREEDWCRLFDSEKWRGVGLCLKLAWLEIQTNASYQRAYPLAFSTRYNYITKRTKIVHHRVCMKYKCIMKLCYNIIYIIILFHSHQIWLWKRSQPCTTRQGQENSIYREIRCWIIDELCLAYLKLYHTFLSYNSDKNWDKIIILQIRDSSQKS